MLMNANQEEITAEMQVARIFEWRRGFNAMYLIDLGVHLSLFRALAEVPGSSPEELATRLGLQAHHVNVWCKTAYAQEILDADDKGGFRLAPFFDSILANPNHPRYLGGYVRLGTEVAAEDFRRCREAFRTGKAVPFQGRGEAFAQIVAQATQGLQVLTARKILPGLADLRQRLDTGGTILEIGCGTGNLLLELAKAFPSARCVGIDIDETSLAIAREKIEEAGLGARVEVRQGTPEAVLEPASVDACVMIEVLHEIAPALRPTLVRTAAAMLRPGGWMVIVDETYPSTLEEMRRPEFRFPVQTGFEELVWGNVIPTREEQESLLRDAGFTGPISREIVGEGFTVLTMQR
jgi:2-polyprenyl-3-methyl-5-hydroxy-6-metoxy-1,4-benzoquinol methylase